MNSVQLLGRLTRDPVLRTTKSDKSVVNFGLALNDRDEAVFVDVTLWGAQADAFVRFFKKGNLVALEGRLSMDEYKGNKKLFVTANRWHFTGEPRDSETPQF